uniref:Kinase n=1 Tax=Solanum tuberosum TaxID=4113 RepID=M0ZLQ5_SOLTU
MLFIALISSLLLHLMTVTMTLTPQYDYNATDHLLLNCVAVLKDPKLAVPVEDFDGRQCAFYTVAASTNSSKAVRKEFVINVNEFQILNITFSPSPNSYAFVNGIEIVSMPTNLYIGGDNRIKLVGQNDPYSIYNDTALETLYRLNVGGHSIASTEDTGMYRVYEEFVVVYGFQTPKFDVNITYTTETPP